jgi:hypothetical protein
MWRDRIWKALPAVVVEDADDQRMLFIPNGIRWFAPSRDGRILRLPEGLWELVERTGTNGPILSFAWPDVPHAVLLFFHPDWAMRNWYVNLERPLDRTKLGFDTEDRVLDVVVAPDLSSFQWKDEDELEEAVGRGLFTAEQAEGFRSEGERALRRVLNRQPPFDRDWSTWRPDPSWPIPELPPGWDAV